MTPLADRVTRPVGGRSVDVPDSAAYKARPSEGERVIRRLATPTSLCGSLLATALFLAPGCRGLGPDTVSSGGFDYSHALSESWKRTMLLNLVKTRYVDAPIFLDVSSVINQYEMISNVDLTAALVSGSLNDTLSLGANRSYADRPTITYTPMNGERFMRTVMTPLPVSSLVHMVASGVEVDTTLALSVMSINGLKNRITAAMGERAADPAFVELLMCFRRLQLGGNLELRSGAADGGPEMLLHIPKSAASVATDSAVVADIDRVRTLLRLDPTVEDFPMKYGVPQGDGRAIMVLTRSMLLILAECSSWIRVPEKDVQEGRVRPTAVEGPGPLRSLICVHSGVDCPADAFASVPYRGYHFWIDDQDLQSKRALSFMMLFFSLTEPASGAGVPVVTIPAN